MKEKLIGLALLALCLVASASLPLVAFGAEVKVGFVTGIGGKNDKSVNESTHEGMLRAESELGVFYTVIEPKSIDDFQPSLEGLVLVGNQLIVGLGFDMAPVVGDVAALYPNAKFAIIDDFVDEPNVQSVKFREHEGSFLVGVIAGMMTKTNKVGFVGGMDTSVINRFEVGFAAGVKSVNPEAAKGLIGDAVASGHTVKFSNNFSDVNRGYELGKSLINWGCDVIYHAAGSAGMGVFHSVKEANDGENRVWAIGVDKDQALSSPEYAPYILTSMIKKADVASYLAVESIVNGTFESGLRQLGVKEDAVGIADSSPVNTPAEVLKLVAKYRKMIEEGTLIVPSTREELVAFEPIDVD